MNNDFLNDADARINAPMASTTGQLLDVHAVAEKLKCSPRTVARLSRNGEMPAGLKIGALRRWSEAEINAWIAGGARKMGTTSEVQPLTGRAAHLSAA